MIGYRGSTSGSSYDWNYCVASVPMSGESAYYCISGSVGVGD